MIACWYKTYIRLFGEETKKKGNLYPPSNLRSVVIILFFLPALSTRRTFFFYSLSNRGYRQNYPFFSTRSFYPPHLFFLLAF
jgi:hypothetical protein